MHRRRALSRLAALGLVAVLATSCGTGDGGGSEGTAADGGRRFLSVGTAPPGGAFFVVGGAISEVLDGAPGHDWDVNAEATKGSQENIRRLVAGDLDLALANSAISYFAVRGEAGWDRAYPVRAVATLASNVALFITPASSSVRTVTDLKGRRVVVGPAGAGFEYFIRPLLAAHGVTYDDFAPLNNTQAGAVDMLSDGSAAAAFLGGAVPTASITQASASQDVFFIPYDAAAMQQVTDEYVFFRPATIPANTYRGQDAPFNGLDVGSMHLIAAESADEELIYELTRILWESRAQVVAKHPAGRAINEKNVARSTGIPFHAGAERFYREQGLWPEAGAPDFVMSPSARQALLPVLSVLLGALVVAEVNYPVLAPQSRLGLFALLGLTLAFLTLPAHPRLKDNRIAAGTDWLLAGLAALCCGYVVVQSEPVFAALWTGGQSLGDRAGQESSLDIAIGVIGLLLVLEAARRALGPALSILAAVFLIYALVGASLPDWLLPHRGYPVGRLVSQTFLHSQGVFSIALQVMFTYVFLFVLLGAFLERTGATQYIIDLARRLFAGSPGGPAKVAVLSSGLMGSLSGSAVANTATTGTFTIPMMRSAGFDARTAAGIEAAASTGGALVPPVMGAGAYMMLEIIDPPVTFLQIIRAALIPAVLYYLSLFLIVHFTSRAIGARGEQADGGPPPGATRRYEGLVFLLSFAGLIVFLIMGYTAFRAVSLALAVGLAVSFGSSRTRLGLKDLLGVLQKSARDAVPLVAAAACVGVILGVVTLTGVGTRFPALLLPLAQESLFLALGAIMLSSLVLGMGLPSAVCYLLLATLIGPVLGDLGVVPLAAHLFIFYFGMMSMVTPPVALAAYAAGSIAGTNIMLTGVTAFRFALVGFTLPYMFVFRPQLLMLAPDGSAAGVPSVALAMTIAVLGIVPFAAGIAGHLLAPLSPVWRGACFLAAALLLYPDYGRPEAGAAASIPWVSLAGLAVLTAVVVVNRGRARRTHLTT